MIEFSIVQFFIQKILIDQCLLILFRISALILVAQLGINVIVIVVDCRNRNSMYTHATFYG